MELRKKESYAIQIGAYLKNGDYGKAREMSERMLEKFPREPLSHFMAAKSCYFSGDYGNAAEEGKKALGLSEQGRDAVVSAIVAASALFMLKKYDEGYELLIPFRSEDDEVLKKLLLLFSMVTEHGKEAAEFYKELHELNRKAAADFLRELAEEA